MSNSIVPQTLVCTKPHIALNRDLAANNWYTELGGRKALPPAPRVRDLLEQFRQSTSLIQRQRAKFYQITGRLYGCMECYERVPVKKKVMHNGRQYEVRVEIKPTAHFLELLEAVKAVIELRKITDFAIITHMPVEAFAREYFGLTEADTLHFGALRGRNDFQHKQALFILGTPSWGGDAVHRTAAAMFPSRVEPFSLGEGGKVVTPEYQAHMVEYRLSAEGLAMWKAARGEQYNGAARMVGRYVDPILQAILQQGREAELMQAIYRARPITNPAEIWIFSPVPVPEIELDGLFDDPPIAPGRFSWVAWSKVRTWHNSLPEGTVYGYTELAEATGADLKYLQNIKALEAIEQYYGSGVERVRESKGRGRPTEKIRKITQK